MSFNISYTSNFLLVLATEHSQDCFVTKVEGNCTCSQLGMIIICNMSHKVQFDEYSAAVS